MIRLSATEVGLCRAECGSSSAELQRNIDREPNVWLKIFVLPERVVGADEREVGEELAPIPETEADRGRILDEYARTDDGLLRPV